MGGTWEQSWEWTDPDWEDINNPDTSAVGFIKGDGLSEEQSANLDDFINYLKEYATNPMVPEGSFALWAGPLNKQDGTELAAAGQIVEPLDVWYLDQLLEGMTGASQ
jgi:simple sugar transport system substrate-binding protein